MSDQIEIEEYDCEIRLLTEEEQKQMEALEAQRRKASIPLYEVAPTSADVEPVVRCKDCANWNSETHGCLRNPSISPWWENDFCSYGARMDGEQDG